MHPSGTSYTCVARLMHLRQSALASLRGFCRRAPIIHSSVRRLSLPAVTGKPTCRAVCQATEKTFTIRSNRESQSSSGEDFLATGGLESLGLVHAVVQALKGAGYSRPSQVQALASEPILSGKNVVLAAETGSGKTLAYLAPIISQLLKAAEEGRDGEDQGALILCPNASLCDQVVAFANQLRGPDSQPLVRSARVSTGNPPPPQLPHIVTATPASLINSTHEFAETFGWNWSRVGIVARMRWVVVDEADLLLTGSFQRDLTWILGSMRDGDRSKAEERLCAELGISLEQFQQLPKNVQKQGLREGAQALLHSGLVSRRDGRSGTEAAQSSPSPQPRRSWARQYLFVAATLPDDGHKSVATSITQAFPDAVWLSGQQLHHSVRNVAHRWLPVDELTWSATLQRAVAEGRDASGGRGKTLVFAGTVAAAESAAEVLRGVGLRPLVYHREVPLADREQILLQATTADGIVMVCTDAAARGLDIPGLSHVVQADFAASAVDFIHRVGRTGRAGHSGTVTSLYVPEMKILAEAIREAVESGQPVEGAFSRNRSFRKKVRKYGKYVPRGQQG